MIKWSTLKQLNKYFQGIFFWSTCFFPNFLIHLFFSKLSDPLFSKFSNPLVFSLSKLSGLRIGGLFTVYMWRTGTAPQTTQTAHTLYLGRLSRPIVSPHAMLRFHVVFLTDILQPQLLHSGVKFYNF